MKVNIYYGGRGLIEDPTIYVINKITEILEELRVQVERINLYEEKNSISVLPKALKEVDGILLATHLEWIGVGGYMQQFLDACWLYADKEHLRHMYMFPVVMASTYGERDVECFLNKAWEMLGGIPVEGLCAYVEDTSAFETDSMIARTIEKKAEAFYRNMNQRTAALPSSSNEVKNKVLKAKSMNLTPQESEQLSEYVSNDTYVKKQKEDIEELALMFKGMLGESENESKYIKMFKESFAVGSDVSACYQIRLTDNKEDILIKVEGNIFECTNELAEKVDILIKTKASVLDHIIEGNQTFQSAFMSGDLTAKGNFNILRTLDTLFIFQ